MSFSAEGKFSVDTKDYAAFSVGGITKHFPETFNVHHGGDEQNSLFSKGPVIKCFT